MKTKRYPNTLQILIDKANSGNSSDIDCLMQLLGPKTDFTTTRNIDFALSLVKKLEGIERICYYLFNGNQIQRNYSSLFFNRRGDWKIVVQAYKQGLIDEIQAFAR